jgi:hypothetical protein
MRNALATLMIASVLVPAALCLGGCNRTSAIPAHIEPAHLTAVIDVSNSTRALTDAVYADRVIEQIADEFGRYQLGDVAHIVIAGDRSHAVNPLPIGTGYRLRIPAAKQKLGEQLKATIATYRAKGGDGSTNLLMALREAKPICSIRSELVVVSDGDEESTEYSVSRALVAGKPVELPSPPPGYLRGCKVTMIGLGVIGGQAEQSILPDSAMQALRTGWENYFRAAGVAPSDVTFRSII